MRGDGPGGASPEDAPASEPVAVVAAVIRREGRYLVGRRPARKRHGGLWEFPGGKLLPGETMADAVERELEEELSMACRATEDILWSAQDPGSEFIIHFVAVEADGEPEAIEHDEVGWRTPPELAEMEMAPSDAAFVSALLVREPDTGS